MSDSKDSHNSIPSAPKNTEKAEREFFSWLSNKISPHALKEITASCRMVGSMLIQKGRFLRQYALPRSPTRLRSRNARSGRFLEVKNYGIPRQGSCYKSISSDLNQSFHTLAAAFVPADSPLQSFPDVVMLFMEERHNLPMRMPGEELRLELRDAGMLEAGEMIYALPKSLDDYRFAWTDENKTVLIRGNK